MRILFLTDNFPPENNAPASRTYAHCKIWSDMGHDVTVITCFPNFPQGKVFGGYRNRRIQKENLNGIKVVRVWSFIAANTGVVKRTLDFMSFGVSSFFAAWFQDCDVIIATSPQFFTAVSGSMISRIKGVPWIMEVRDLWPASIVSVGAIKGQGLIKVLEKIESGLYRHAKKIVVVTDSFKEELSTRGFDQEKIFVVKNGVDHQFNDEYKIKDSEKINSELLDIKRNSNFLIGYIGTHGLAHNLGFILRSIKELPKEITFVFVGDGAEKSNLLALASSLDLTNVHFVDPVPRAQVPLYLSQMDAVLIPLRKDPLFKSVLPSKIFESAAMGIPILLGVEGEAASLIREYEAGLCFDPDNKEDFKRKVQTLINSNELRIKLGRGGKRLAKDFDRRTLAIKMLGVVESGLA